MNSILIVEDEPPVARFIGEYSLMRIVARTALAPVVYGVKYPIISAPVVLAGLLTIIISFIKMRRRNGRVNLQIDKASGGNDNTQT